MYNIRFFFVAIAILVSSASFAQFSNNSNKTTTAASTDGWKTLWVEWNPSTFHSDLHFRGDVDGKSFTGLSIGYSQAFNVLAGKPLFVEAGVGMQYSFCHYEREGGWTDDGGQYDESDLKLSLLSVKVPINLLYKFDIPNTSISLLPFVGLSARLNIIGNANDRGDNKNLFDKEEIDWDGEGGKRFQLGWNIGLKACLQQKYILGISYGSDFTESFDDSKFSTASVTLGYVF